VDLALRHGKPFAVVPCCVHAVDFPRRWVAPAASSMAQSGGQGSGQGSSSDTDGGAFTDQSSGQSGGESQGNSAAVYSSGQGGGQTTSATATGHSGGHGGTDKAESGAARETVRSYDQFLRYLQAKAPGIEVAALPFEGRNVCVYRTLAAVQSGAAA
jgi:hypothetical protein